MFGKSTHSNTDGFVVRRRAAGNNQRLGAESAPIPEQFLHAPRLKSRAHGSSAINQSTGLAGTQAATHQPAVSKPKEQPGKSDLSDVLSQLPAADLPDVESKKGKSSLSKKKIKRLAIALAIILLLVFGYVGVKFLIASGRVFNGNLFSALFNDGKELKKDQYGNTNILIFGTSEDSDAHEEGENHLADSIMIASIDSTDKTGFMMSVPRDLLVKYGEACNAGYEGRINEAYGCGLLQNNNEEEGARKLEAVIEEHFGIDLQYNIHLNYTALREAVNAVGGVTVEIESDDPRGIYDPNFDWQCGFQCNLVKWPNGPANLNGEQALALARARNAAGGYGLGGGNFDREQNQQKILLALKDKASSAGVLANPVKVTGLLDSLGNNVQTNFDAGEIKTLVKLAQEINTDQLKRISLVDENDPLVTTATINGASIVHPLAGIYDYSEIQSVLKAHLSGDTALLENATIDVLNGSGTVGAAQTKADELEALGYIIDEIGNAPAGDHKGIVLYDLSEGKKQATRAKLQQQLGIGSVGTAEALPSGVITTADFVIIIGIDGSN